MSEVLRNVVPVIQPSPARNAGGDCFACATTAVLRSLFPERDVMFDEVFDAFKNQKVWGTEDRTIANTWRGLTQTFAELRYQRGFPIEYRTDHVAPTFDPDQWSCTAWRFGVGDYDYQLRAEAWLAAGWLLMAEIKFDGTGPLSEDGSLYTPDHIVVIDGARRYWEPNEHGAALRSEIHIVCSVRGTYWERPQVLQRMHGVGGWQMIRREDK